jgi:hypothetical protein
MTNKIKKEFTIRKALSSNIRDTLNDAVKYHYDKMDDYGWPWVLDYDEDTAQVYFEAAVDGDYRCFRDTYTMSDSDTTATLSGTPVEVVRRTAYEDIDSSGNDFERSVMNAIKKYFGGSSKEEVINKNLPVLKQFEDEQMVAIEKLYIHPDDVDGVGDTISLEDTYAMVDSLNKAIDSGSLQSGLFHKVNADDVFTVVKAWVQEVDCVIGETQIKEGQPLIKVQFHNKDAWDLRKAGEISGISIGARAKEIEVINE